MLCALPNSSFIRNWLSNIHAQPGFLANVIDAAAESGERNFNLIIDSMSIRKQTVYQRGQPIGFCNYGGIIVEDRVALASEALVFILVPLDGVSKQFVIAYFLVDKISSQIQAELVNTALVLAAKKVYECAVSHVTVAQQIFPLLRSWEVPSIHYNVCLISATLVSAPKVYVTLDACHMLKLARNALVEMGSFVTEDGEHISWHYINRLMDLQNRLGLHFSNRPSSEHVNWQKAKMKVRLTAQVFSKSVADALQFLNRASIPGFEDFMAAVEFIGQVRNSHMFY